MADKKHPDNDASAAGVPDDGTAAAGAAAPADAAGAAESGGADSDGADSDAVDSADGIEEDELTVQDILDAAEREAAEPSSEHLADLKRVTAEYANYRRRTEANRAIEKERVTGDIVKALIPVLDDIYRAEKHGDLVPDSAFATIAAKLRASVERMGLTSFGEVGDLFDPTMHEAIFQQPNAAVDTETVGDVAETGYYLGSTLLRAAKVVVQVPSDG
ncbi:nucleotide exchange factor GrpE [Cryobacterium sp. PH29-G1]|uniref:nucleotide exchange factor GrpE n=1 Tax=Cryobacterium sp. PH29-G1 TaxID=3046211 RepID=UPI0024BBE264|nr:nucleotide exchange factor GrpE [Cryobacterium sp. PH29-G1]MDJ0348652.1 nucleotide exchange factor GrpE [Cryobacterium sp. PH29-G1]